jgi:hypothetical protein
LTADFADGRGLPKTGLLEDRIVEMLDCWGADGSSFPNTEYRISNIERCTSSIDRLRERDPAAEIIDRRTEAGTAFLPPFRS